MQTALLGKEQDLAWATMQGPARLVRARTFSLPYSETSTHSRSINHPTRRHRRLLQISCTYRANHRIYISRRRRPLHRSSLSMDRRLTLILLPGWAFPRFRSPPDRRMRCTRHRLRQRVQTIRDRVLRNDLSSNEATATLPSPVSR